MRKTFILLLSVAAIGFIAYQYGMFGKNNAVSCGGDWNYSVKCPLGTYCASSNLNPLAGGTCQPYLTPLFRIFR